MWLDGWLAVGWGPAGKGLAGCLAGLRVAGLFGLFGHDWLAGIQLPGCVFHRSHCCLAACLAVWQAAGLGCIGLGLVRLGWAELARIAVTVIGN